MITLSSQLFSAGSSFVVGFIAELERVDGQTLFPHLADVRSRLLPLSVITSISELRSL